MKVKFNSSAKKELAKLDRRTGERIYIRIYALRENPFPPSSRKLTNYLGYRIRVGDYKVVYSVDAENRTVEILKIAHRKEVYKHLG